MLSMNDKDGAPRGPRVCGPLHQAQNAAAMRLINARSVVQALTALRSAAALWAATSAALAKVAPYSGPNTLAQKRMAAST